ncbi:hypothetical protein F5X68DRAFT_259014 [Plectosphaerella plurivora]|uniref:Succinate dehydrogenase assembly factor 3 n=1 Tax=Plectosphaerella plurivora TaxID=936078 RepID=A0A9P9AEV5_9PEZI|nr:hypothetical protein F5X68DRAFT_259014 [Plectosphaerella plurivora]
MFRPSPSRLASAAANTTRLGSHASMPLLPPISLYRRLLRAHRKFLPAESRLLSDEYIKAEFRAHRNVENPAHLIGFLTEWQLYAQKIEGESWMGDKIEQNVLEKLSDDQVVQLYKLMQAIKERDSESQ